MGRIFLTFKSIMFLLGIVSVWGYLIYTIWELQLFITLLPFVVNHPLTHRLRKSFWMWQDQGVNMLFFGHEDETVSSRVGVLCLLGSKTALGVAYVIDWVFYVVMDQVNHCVVSIEHDEQKFQARKLLEKEGAGFVR